MEGDSPAYGVGLVGWSGGGDVGLAVWYAAGFRLWLKWSLELHWWAAWWEEWSDAIAP